MEPYVDGSIEEMCNRLAGFANTSTEVNMAFWMQAYAFDVVGELAFGRAFGYLSSGQDIGGQMANLRGWLRKRFAVGMIPWFFPIFMSPIAAVFSSASKVEQEDSKKRQAVIHIVCTISNDSSLRMPSKGEWADLRIVGICYLVSLKHDTPMVVR